MPPPLIRILILCMCLLGSLVVQGQSITSVLVSESLACTGSDIQVTSYLDSTDFDANTEYTLRLGLLRKERGSYVFYIYSSQVISGSSPSYSNVNNTYYIEHQFTIPKGIDPRTDFQMWVSSTNPTAGGTTAAVSNTFEVRTTPESPVVSNNGPICIGGTLNFYASTISGATYSWTGPNGFTSTAQNPVRTNATTAMAGTYSVVATVNGCSSEPATTIVGGSIAADSQATAGTNNWIGHVYDGTGFNTYAGNYTETESFDRNFGGNTICFGILANANPISIYTETYSVRYRMNSSKKGLYVVDLGSDDGSRLRVDGNLIYNNWIDQAYSIRPRVLMSLSGNSNLIYEFYENAGGNRVSFGNITLVIENILSGNIEQKVCSGGAAMQISGDVYGTLPAGISRSGTGYQWSYSTTAGGAKTDITGATAATYTPDVTTAPFSNGGTFYIFRKAVLVSGNNTGFTSYAASNVSNPAILTVDTPISNNTINRGNTGTVCATLNENETLTITAPEGTIFTSVDFASYGTPNGSCESFTLGTCHSTTSRSVVENYLLGKNSASIPATNAIFGDPCSGTYKRLYVQATYGPPEEDLCRGDEPGTIIGSTPAGGANPAYLWETSVTGPDSGFSTGSGTNNTKDYAPGPLNQTTWMRRQVTNTCGVHTSNVIELKVNIPTAELSGPTESCAGEAVDLTATFSGNGPWDFTLNSGGTFSTYQGVQSPYTITVNPSVTTSFSITSVTDAFGCSSNSESNPITVTVKEEALWTGITSTDWNTASNWECNILPTLQANVTIPSGLINYPILSSGNNGLANDLIIEAGASVLISNNWIRIAGDLQNSGIFNVENGSVSFEGTTVQNISSGAFFQDNVLNLNIKNSAGVTSNANIRVLNSLKVEEGVFNTGNSLLLVSDSSGTAYIDGTGNGQVAGIVSMQRYLSNPFGYKYFSTPFQNSTVADLASNFNLTNSETGFPHLYEYLENRKDSAGNDLTGWQKYLDTNATLKPGFGYAINPSGVTDTLTLQLSGQVNNGTLGILLENNNGFYTNGFNLVGNPYPSPINWNLMVPTLEGVDNAIHFFTATAGNRYTGTYTSYVDGISTDGRSSSIIPSMQGFFVRVSDPANAVYPSTATLQFTNAFRTGNQAQQSYYKSKNKAEVPQIRLTAAFKGEKLTDATVIYFRNGGTPEFEKDIDAQKILNTAIDVPSFYSLSTKEEKLSINAVSGFDIETMEIPLGISTERSGEITLVLSDNNTIFPSLHIYLRDNKKKVLKNLDDNPVYSFTSQKGENNDRFVLLFSSKKLSTAEIALATEDFMVYNQNKNIVVRLNLLKDNKGKVILSNMSGQVLQSQTGSGKEEIRFSRILATGVYFVTLETEKETQTKKVIYKD